MTDDPTEETTEESTEPKEGTPAWYRDQMARKDKQLADQTTARRTAEGKLADYTFEKAGIDPTEGTGLLFFENYKGEMTVEAVTAAAAKYGLAKEPSEEETERAAAEERVASLGPGSKPVEDDVVDEQAAIAADEAEKAGTQEHIGRKLRAGKYV